MAAAWTVVVLPNPAGAIREQTACRDEHSAHGGSLVSAEAWCFGRDGVFHVLLRERVDDGGGEFVEEVEDAPFQEEVVDG